MLQPSQIFSLLQQQIRRFDLVVLILFITPVRIYISPLLAVGSQHAPRNFALSLS